ncbi:MAG: DNA polymerase III subunit gamma/tau [Anaerolineaceae bacterium]|nr:DNA polymerase III subunit gamma/tau [Anaerolineaceae bacterium]
MSLSYYRKWRPRLWDEVIGQQHVTQSLRNAIAADKVAHAYLFAGPRGTGKTTTARLLAKAVNCLADNLTQRPCDQCAHCQAVREGTFLDLIEIDAASNTSVEDVRDLRDKINYSPNQGRYKVYIIDEVHMLSTAAFNALLKTLEEPPEHAIFILATTEINRVPATVLSRCQRHEFRRVPVVDIIRVLQDLAQKEHLTVEPEALALIARQATGSLRDGISLLDQLASSGKPVTLAESQQVLGTATSQAVVELVNALLDHDPQSGINRIHTALDGGADPRQFARQVVDYLRNLLLIKLDGAGQIEAPAELRSQMDAHARWLTTSDLLIAIRTFNTAVVDERGSWQPGLPLELAFAEMVFRGQPASEAVQPPAAPIRPQASVPEPSTRFAAVQTPTASTPSPSTAEPLAQKPKRASSSVAPSHALPPAATPSSGPTDEPDVPVSGRVISLQMINQAWRQILARLHEQKHLKTEAFLRSSRPMGLKDGALILGVNSEFTKSKLEAGDHLELTRHAIGHVLGVDMPVRCVIANSRAGDSLPPDLDVDSEGMVGTALRDLGGEVVDVQ